MAYLGVHCSSYKGVYLDTGHMTGISDLHRGEIFDREGGDNNFTTPLGEKSSLFQLAVKMDSKFCCNWLENLKTITRLQNERGMYTLCCII